MGGSSVAVVGVDRIALVLRRRWLGDSDSLTAAARCSVAMEAHGRVRREGRPSRGRETSRRVEHARPGARPFQEGLIGRTTNSSAAITICYLFDVRSMYCFLAADL